MPAKRKVGLIAGWAAPRGGGRNAGPAGPRSVLPVHSRSRRSALRNICMATMHGFYGERILVNGREQPVLPVATRAYRLRVLNGSNARFYKLAWSDRTPMTIVGGDGGLLERAVTQRYVTLAPAQRVDLIVDLSGRAVGTALRIAERGRSRRAMMPVWRWAANGTGMGMGRGMRGGMATPAGSVPNGAALTLLTLNVVRAERAPFRLPAPVSTFGPGWNRVSSAPVRRVPLSFQAGQSILGGRTFAMMEAAPDETLRAGSTHAWEFANMSGMMGMQMAHPIHLHGPQFRVIGRTRTGAATSLHEGIVDAGWTDTVLVMPGDCRGAD